MYYVYANTTYEVANTLICILYLDLYLVSCNTRQKIFRAKRLLKGTRLVITENLTKRRSELLQKARSVDGVVAKGVDPDTKVGGTAYMSTQRDVLEGQTGSHRAKRANFGRGVRGSSP